MSNPNLRSRIIRLAAAKPELRKHLLPLVSDRQAASEFLDDTGVPEKLPFAPDKYFVGGTNVPLRLLDATRAREKGIHNARVFMWKAYIGEAERRKPISIRPTGDGRYEVLDGNSTYANAVASRWPTIRADIVDVVGVGHTASVTDDLEVVRVDPTRAGFGGAGMVRNLSRGVPHDPNEIVSVEVTLSGTAEALVSRPAMYLAQSEARRHGIHGGMVRRKNNPYRDPQGRMLVTYIVE
jgi:hypothetical protein